MVTCASSAAPAVTSSGQHLVPTLLPVSSVRRCWHRRRCNERDNPIVIGAQRRGSPRVFGVGFQYCCAAPAGTVKGRAILDSDPNNPVSYTHLTLPTNREV